VAAYVVERAEPGDGIAFMAPYVRLPFGYYAEKLGGPVPEAVGRAFSWEPGDTERDLVTGELAIYPRPRDDELTDLGDVAHPRVWIVLSSDEPGQAAAMRASLAGYDVVAEESFVDVDVILYERT
jgi:hypothetical protein